MSALRPSSRARPARGSVRGGRGPGVPPQPPPAGPSTRRARIGRLALPLLGIVPLLFAGAAVGVVGHGTYTDLATWGSSVEFAVGAAFCFMRTWSTPVERPVWRWFGIGCTLWAGANFYYAFVVAPAAIPLPSLADIGYFSFPFVIALGLFRYAQARVGRLSADMWLDALVVALGTAAVVSAVVFRLIALGTHGSAAVITSLVYPLEDVALLGVLFGVGSALSWRLRSDGALVAAAVVLITGADVLVLPGLLDRSYIAGAWANFGWTAGIALIAAAAWRGVADGPPRLRRAKELRPALPIAVSILALAVVVLNGEIHLGRVPPLLATGAVLTSMLRLFRSYSYLRALADSRRLALTDDLTGLPNRRRLMTDLEGVWSESTPRLLALFDLDGFKHFNDTFGHPDGDILLAALAGRLAAAVAPDGVAYRLGGDEFCAIVPAGHGGHRKLAAASAALRYETPASSITSSVGVVELPLEARSISAAMRIADQRMYAQKDRRPAAARQQARDVLLGALAEQQPDLHVHARDVTSLAAEVAQQLGMSSEAVDDVVRAAELHDVGKLAIPREILDKPGPLDESEWKVMREHTLIGERMLSSATSLRNIAPLVRSSHERWDGEGYPDGLRGEEIPLGARIVAACDSFDAMVTDRPYRAGMSERAAIEELRRCSGKQFDPLVVTTLLKALAAHSGTGHERRLTHHAQSAQSVA